MKTYVARRLLALIPVGLVVATMAFLLIQLSGAVVVEGVPPYVPSWGNILSEGRLYMDDVRGGTPPSTPARDPANPER